MSASISETTPRKFSLKKRETEIELELEDGTSKEFIIREMSGSQRDTYLKIVMSKASFGNDGALQKVNDPSGLQPALICLCMFDKVDGKPVSQQFVNSIRTTVQNEIFELCSEINGLDKGAETASKNA